MRHLSSLIRVAARVSPVLLVFVFALTVFFWTGLNAAMEMTSNETFCTSCHEMKDNPYNEYILTSHYKNHAGVRATCPDCHVPREWSAKMIAKIGAAKDVYRHFAGMIDTPEKYSEQRLRMAEAVWAKMKSTDSRECRSCHSFENMALEEQQGRARRKHEQIIKNGNTCIDCHKGIAHKLPDGYERDN